MNFAQVVPALAVAVGVCAAISDVTSGGSAEANALGTLTVREGGVIVRNLIGRFVREEAGQDIIEYALLAAFVSIVAATIVQTIGTDVKTIYTNVKTQTTAAAAGS